MIRTFLRVTLPLAGVNFLNQASRAALALLGPVLALEFGLTGGELGLVAAATFVAYGLAQLPVGLALDLHGPRRTQITLATVALAGFATCALARDPLTLALGRVLTGVGVSAGLMAMVKANVTHFPPARVAAATGIGVFIGAAGGVAATLPVQTLLPTIGWRGAFWLLAVLAVLVIAWITASVPAHVRRAPRRGLWAETAEFGRIFAHPRFIRTAPAVAMISVLNFTYQGLWAGPWLRDAGGLDDAPRAVVLMTYGLGFMTGNLVSGLAAARLAARGIGPLAVAVAASVALVAIQAWLALAPPRTVEGLAAAWFLWAAFAGAGPVGYAAVTAGFPPDVAGRAATALNFSMLAVVVFVQNAIGLILDLWPRTASGGWDPAGYAWAMALTLAMQVAATIWLIARKDPAPA